VQEQQTAVRPTTENHRSTGPLDGIKVLDVSTVYAAPITAMLLGDMGADVLKVEHPNGDPARTHGWNREGHGLWWKVIARNKRAVTLNLGRPEGQELLRELVADADVIVPVPLHRSRLWWRRFNQAMALAAVVSRVGGVPCDPFLLARVKRTQSQGRPHASAAGRKSSGRVPRARRRQAVA